MPAIEQIGARQGKRRAKPPFARMLPSPGASCTAGDSRGFGNNQGMAMRVRWGFDRVTPSSVAGWVFHPDAPDWHLEMVVHHGAELIGSQTAASLRVDLRNAGIGSGDHAFDIPLRRDIAFSDLPNLKVTAIGKDRSEYSLTVEPGKWRDDLRAPRSAPAGAAEKPTSLDVRTVKRIIRLGSSYSQSDPLGLPTRNACDLANDPNVEVLPAHKAMVANGNEDWEAVMAAARRDTSPIPQIDNRENYGRGSDLSYWISGYLHHRVISRIAGKYGINGGRCYDFGGSSGRVCRHFAIQSDAWDPWISDFRETSVEFVARYLPMKVKPFMNSAFPSLPLSDNYFDLVFGCSVFTHINETEIPWLLELRRILRIGGIALLSVHNDDTWAWLAQRPEDGLRKLMREWRPDVADLPTIPEGQRIVVSHRDDDPYNCNVFHSDAYLRGVWGRFFEIEEIVPHGMGTQAVVVCRRTE